MLSQFYKFGDREVQEPQRFQHCGDASHSNIYPKPTCIIKLPRYADHTKSKELRKEMKENIPKSRAEGDEGAEYAVKKRCIGNDIEDCGVRRCTHWAMH
jgi:hypothetical protein